MFINCDNQLVADTSYSFSPYHCSLLCRNMHNNASSNRLLSEQERSSSQPISLKHQSQFLVCDSWLTAANPKSSNFAIASASSLSLLSRYRNLQQFSVKVVLAVKPRVNATACTQRMASKPWTNEQHLKFCDAI